jgi:hypothetical protein
MQDIKCCACGESTSNYMIDVPLGWVCKACDQEIIYQVLVLADCEVCEQKHYTYHTKGPSRCKNCIEEKKVAVLCVPHALENYVNARLKPEESGKVQAAYRRIRADRSYGETTRVSHLLDEYADMWDVSKTVAVRRLAKQQFITEFIDHAITLHREMTMDCFKAIELDAQYRDIGGTSNYFETFCRDLEGTLCPVADDKAWSPCPFL